MFKKRIQAIKNFCINTRQVNKVFAKDEVGIINFGSQAEYKALLSFGNFKEVHGTTRIPVVRNSTFVKEQTGTGTKPIAPTPPPIAAPPLVSIDEKKLSCDQCDRTFATKRGLNLHIRRSHKIDIVERPVDVTIPEDKSVDKSADKPVEKPCQNCDTLMTVTGQSNIQGEITTVFSCPICGDK